MARTTNKAAPASKARTNTTAAEKANDAVVSADGVAAAAATPEASDQSDAVSDPQGSTPPKGGDEILARGIEVRAMRDGHRRAGRRWTKAPTVVAIDEFSEEQIEQLLGDPALSVIVIGEHADKEQ